MYTISSTESCRVVLPERPVVTHQSNGLAACRDFRERVAVISGAAKQREKFAPGIGFLPPWSFRGPWLLRFGSAAPGRQRAPQFINVATSQPLFQHVKTGLHRALLNVRVARVPTYSNAGVITNLHDSMNVLGLFRPAAVDLQPDFNSMIAGDVTTLVEGAANLVKRLRMRHVFRKPVGPHFHAKATDVLSEFNKAPRFVNIVLHHRRIRRFEFARGTEAHQPQARVLKTLAHFHALLF